MLNISSKAKAWLAFGVVSFFWGTTYLAIRIGVAHFPPLLFAGIRNLLAGLILCTVFLLKGAKLPSGKELKNILIIGFFILFLCNGTLTWSEVYIDSGLVAMICSLFPFLVAIFSLIMNKNEKLSLMLIAGLFLGLIGQTLIFGFNIDKILLGSNYIGIGILLFSQLTGAYGTVYQRKHHGNTNPFFAAGIQMLFAGILLCISATFKGELSQKLIFDGDVIWSLLYLVLAGSILTYSCYMYALKKIPATAFSLYAYINTLVAVLLGWFILNENRNPYVFIAIGITFMGGLVVRKSMRKPKNPLSLLTKDS